MKSIRLMERELEFIKKNIEISQKLIEEHKIGKLSILDETQISLLSNQISHMEGYKETLEQRIKYDENKKDIKRAVGGEDEIFN